jgi:hypothetical protein
LQKNSLGFSTTWGRAALVLSAVVLGTFVAAIANRFLDTFLASALVGSASAGLICLGMYRMVRVDYPVAFERFASVLLAIFVTFSFLATVPINVDRSFSVWLLAGLESNRDSSISASDAEFLASQYFSPGSGEISRRIEEQLNIGNIELREGNLSLSSQGEILVALFRATALFFDLNPRYTFPASE